MDQPLANDPRAMLRLLEQGYVIAECERCEEVMTPMPSCPLCGAELVAGPTLEEMQFDLEAERVSWVTAEGCAPR